MHHTQLIIVGGWCAGTMSRKEIEATYAIGRRIEAEERALDAAVMVFTSTHQEVKDQWGLYDGYDPDLERVVRQRYRKGRHFPIMTVIPPGLDFSALKVDSPIDPYSVFNKADTSKGRISHSGVDESPAGTDHQGELCCLNSPLVQASGTLWAVI